MNARHDLECFARAELPPLLRRILEAREAEAAVAARSYSHDNGFVKIVLTNEPAQSSSLRLHVWPAGRVARSNVHNHCWDFDSLVLAGRLQFEEFVEDHSGPIPAFHYTYSPPSDLRYELNFVGRTALRRTSEGVRAAGASYHMASPDLHRTWACSPATTITLVARGPHSRDLANVYSTQSEPLELEVQNSPIEPRVLRGYLTEVMELVKSKRG